MDLTYIIILISAILAIGGLVFKTKKDDKKGIFNKLTVGGYIVMSVLICSFLANIYYQKQKDDKTVREKADTNQKHINDSIQDALRFQVTIHKFQEQRSIDSVRLISDSNRFNVTLLKFGEQLTSQKKALYEIERILTPIGDFSLALELEISFLSPELAKFKAWLDVEMQKNQPINGRLEKIVVSSKSAFIPDSIRDNIIYSLLNVNGELMFFKDSTYLGNPFLSPMTLYAPAESDKGFLNIVTGPDLVKRFFIQNDKFYYDFQNQKMSIEVHLKSSDIQSFQQTQNIVSIKDLAGSYLIMGIRSSKPITNSLPDSVWRIKFCRIHLAGGIILHISKENTIELTKHNRTLYIYKFPKNFEDKRAFARPIPYR